MTEDPVASTLPLTPSTRIPQLDGLRGIAIGLVLFWHYYVTIFAARPGSLAAYLQVSGRLAWTGVDLFFVLSGFLIGGILLDARDASNYFRIFYTRRFFRIVPLYAVCLFGTFLLIPLARGLHASSIYRPVWLENSIPWYSYVAFLQNFWMAVKGSFGQPGLTVTWSLAVEEQFYLTLPLVIRFFEARRRLLVIVAGIVLAPALRTLLYYVWPDKTAATYVLMPCRADALLLGVLAAVLVRDAVWLEKLRRGRRLLQVLLAVFAAGAVLLTLLDSIPGQLRFITVGYTWMAGLYGCTLLYAVTNPDRWLSRFLRWNGFAWLGSIAYGVYLFHMYALHSLFRLVWPQYWTHALAIRSFREWCVVGLALAATLVLCRLSWRYFEKPLLQFGHRTRYEFAATRQAPSLRP